MGQSPVDVGSDADLTPLEYMLRELRNPNTDPSRRDRLAVAAAPFMHQKVGEAGKREAKKAAAEQNDGRFTPAAAPKLSVVKKTA